MKRRRVTVPVWENWSLGARLAPAALGLALVWAGALLRCEVVGAQSAADPFAAPGAGLGTAGAPAGVAGAGAAPVAPAVPGPGAALEVRAGAATPGATAAEPPAGPEDRAARAILETNPQTPEELSRAAKILADLRRPELSRQLLRRLLDAKLDEQQLADLAEHFGTNMFLSMAGRSELHPEAQQLADAVVAAYTRRLQAPQQIAALIAQLSAADPEVRFRAMAGLQAARGAAIGPMIQALADPARAAEHGGIRAALVHFGSDAVGPLVGLLERSEPQVQAQVMQVLAAMNARQAAIYMLGPCTSPRSAPVVRQAAAAALLRLVGKVPAREEAVALLLERAEEYFDQRVALAGEFDGQVAIWGFDPQRKLSVARTLPADLASWALAARLARDAYALAPEEARVKRLYLATLLQCAAGERGWEQVVDNAADPAGREAAGFGAAELAAVLQYAVAHDHPACAAAAAGLLGRIGRAEELLSSGPRPSPLAAALWHPDRRVRLAAAQAIVALGPAQSYPGASYLPKALRFFVATSGQRRAVVAGSRVATARELAGMLAAQGLQTDTAATGEELLRLVLGCPDYEVALIDPAIERPGVGLLLQQLRRDPRSVDLRVGLIARDGFFELAEQAARDDPLTLAFSRPHSEEALRWQLRRLGELQPRKFVPAAERVRQAAAALELLARLSDAPPKIYDLRQVEEAVLLALEVPQLSLRAAAVAGKLGTPQAQTALVEVASRFCAAPETRQAAAVAFAQSIRAHGILLTTAQILRQYDRYNQSADQPPETQRILARILDAIEARARLGAPPLGAEPQPGAEPQADAPTDLPPFGAEPPSVSSPITVSSED